MDFEKLVNKKLFVFFFFLILVFALKFNTLNTPYTGDALGNYVAPSVWIKDNFNPFFGNNKLCGHPPFYYELLALSFNIFGVHRWVSHIFILLSAIITLYYTYLIGSYLYNSKTGFIASLFLLFSPQFFAQIGMVFLDVFLVMMVVITFYYALQRRVYHYLIAGHLLILTKETGVLIIGAIVLYKLLFEEKKLKELALYSSPLLTFLLWLFLSKLVYGWFLCPTSVEAFPNSLETFNIIVLLQVLFSRINQIFIIDYKFFLTLLIFFPVIKNSKFITVLRVIISIIIYLICRYIANILFLIKKILEIDLINFFQINLHNLYSIRYEVPIFFLIICLIPSIIKSKGILAKKLKGIWLFLFCIFSVILFFSFMIYGFQRRYILMVHPLFFIISSRALISMFKNKKSYVFITIIIIILFITKWWGSPYTTCSSCEENLQYISVIEMHQQMAKFIESNYANATILTKFPQSLELIFPWAGYVNKELKVLDIDIKKNTLSIPYDKFDLVYYSTGSGDSKELEEVVNLYNLTLIKKIEKNDKIALLYGKNKYTFPNEF